MDLTKITKFFQIFPSHPFSFFYFILNATTLLRER